MLSRFLVFFFYSSCAHRALHSFPTRRSSDLDRRDAVGRHVAGASGEDRRAEAHRRARIAHRGSDARQTARSDDAVDRKSTRLNSSHLGISYAVFCLKKKKKKNERRTDEQKSQ